MDGAPQAEPFLLRSERATDGVDGCTIRDLDHTGTMTKATERVLEAYQAWQAHLQFVLEGKPIDKKAEEESWGWNGFRGKAMELGLIDCVDTDKATPEYVTGRLSKTWEELGYQRGGMTDIYSPLVSRDEFVAKYLANFHPLVTYAYLDETGWHEPGKMGWFGMGCRDGDQNLSYAQGFLDWLASGNPDDRIVVVDCHT